MPEHSEVLEQLFLKRGVAYSNSEVHGSMAGFYDYGSVGSEIKRRWQDYWRNYFLNLHDNFHEIETTNVMPEQVFKASGHLEHFFDPVAECSKCGNKVRADHILEEMLNETFEGVTAEELNKIIKKHDVRCPKCKGKFKNIETFTLMFPVEVGAGEEARQGYLRPETAQGPFTAFKREFRVNRQKLPLGLAVIGRSFRNEISPRQGLLRTREFTQAELQIFFDPKHLPKVSLKKQEKIVLNVVLAGKKKPVKLNPLEFKKKTGIEDFFVYFLAKTYYFMKVLGFNEENFRLRQLTDEEKAFYNKYHIDLECFLPSTKKWVEVAGFHYRTDHDLKGHQEVSKQSMQVSHADGKCLPHVLEISFGVDRNVFALLDNALNVEDDRTFLKLPAPVAPYDAGIYPLVKKQGFPEKAREIYALLGGVGFKCFYDDGGSIGRRYARADEIGIPWGITVDEKTVEKDLVSVRNRDTKEREYVKLEELPQLLLGAR
jgi:glycyl-tRNA synthetase